MGGTRFVLSEEERTRANYVGFLRRHEEDGNHELIRDAAPENRSAVIDAAAKADLT